MSDFRNWEYFLRITSLTYDVAYTESAHELVLIKVNDLREELVKNPRREIASVFSFRMHGLGSDVVLPEMYFPVKSCNCIQIFFCKVKHGRVLRYIKNVEILITCAIYRQRII